ncbi:MAG: hypothetical protein LJE69_02655 [Thiohalocapsa sp.]|nr:hypothetical protein [Thiohalocapsa sp.]
MLSAAEPSRSWPLVLALALMVVPAVAFAEAQSGRVLHVGPARRRRQPVSQRGHARRVRAQLSKTVKATLGHNALHGDVTPLQGLGRVR